MHKYMMAAHVAYIDDLGEQYSTRSEAAMTMMLRDLENGKTTVESVMTALEECNIDWDFLDGDYKD